MSAPPRESECVLCGNPHPTMPGYPMCSPCRDFVVSMMVATRWSYDEVIANALRVLGKPRKERP